MNDYRYRLELYTGKSSRYICPECKNRTKTFTLYIDTYTGQHINDNVGKCGRESNCGHHYPPKQYFQDNNISTNKINYQLRDKPKIIEVKKPPSFIEAELLIESLKQYEANNFVIYLKSLFGLEITNGLISKYFIGTSKYWRNANVFWQIDIKGKIRTGKIMAYNAITGKRIKEPQSLIHWVHSLLKIPEFNLAQCLFGEHLLSDKHKTVAIVESEKTAIIASVYLPQFIWLACGQLQGLTIDRCKVLEGRNVILYPDLKAFDKWSSKAKELSHIAKFKVSDLLECKANDEDKKNGFDLADYLTKFDLDTFLKKEPNEPTIIEPIQIKLKANEPIIIEQPPIKPTPKTDWSNEIEELETFFKNLIMPTNTIKLNQCVTITNINNFIDTHLNTLRTNNGKPTFEPYLKRLQQLKSVLK
jgi:hypothetical protein